MLWKMSLGALFPVIASIILYLAEKKTAYARLPYPVRQMIAGLIFGGLAVIGTEFGVPITGAVVNVRDAAPLCAGLLFGAPAGIIAGVIGGVERWFSVLWGIGSYTRIACSVSTVLAGVIGALLRKYMFDNKKPSWGYGLAIGMVTEVIHMVMVFLTNMNGIHKAFDVVRACALPMIAFNGISVMLAVIAITLIGKENIFIRKTRQNLAQSFQHWLLVNLIFAFLITGAFNLILQTGLSKNDAVNLLKLNISDVKQDINDASDENLLKITREIAAIFNSTKNYSHSELVHIAGKYKVSEIVIVDQRGIITECTKTEFIGFDMNSGEQSREFLVLLNGTKEYVQSYQPISYSTNISRKYAGIALEEGGFVQVAYDAEEFHKDISAQVIGVTRNRHVGENGCIIICDENFKIISDRNNYEGENLSKTGIWIDQTKMPESECFTSDVYGVKSMCLYEVTEGYMMIAVIPYDEAMFTRDVSVYVSVFMEIIIFAVMFVMIYFLIKKLVVDNIQKINNSLSLITGGNLNVTVDVRGNEEFASLSDDINSTVNTLKHYIDEAAARIDKELEFARSIQLAALPSVFPPYPSRKEFDIYAYMMTAKEVGGDFYDFYLLDENRLAFLIADVSGKGIPAAMFMMTAKTMIKSMVESGVTLAQAFENSNNKLCENNEAGMFVTAWMGILDTRSGSLEFVNAGHNPPVIMRAGGKPEFLKTKPDLILSCMDGIKYHPMKTVLNPGDLLFLYTDGVTEATDSSNNLFGDDRLLKTVLEYGEQTPVNLCHSVKSKIDEFVAEAPQFDDITMLAVRMNSTDKQ